MTNKENVLKTVREAQIDSLITVRCEDGTELSGRVNTIQFESHPWRQEGRIGLADEDDEDQGNVWVHWDGDSVQAKLHKGAVPREMSTHPVSEIVLGEKQPVWETNIGERDGDD